MKKIYFLALFPTLLLAACASGPTIVANTNPGTDFRAFQTYSFFGDLTPVGKSVLKRLVAKYSDIKGPADVIPPVGVANAYDAMHLVAMAINKAGNTDGDAIRKALYQIGSYEGLIKTYKKPFSTDNHDALSHSDYVMVKFEANQIKPVK